MASRFQARNTNARLLRSDPAIRRRALLSQSRREPDASSTGAVFNDNGGR